MLQGHAKGEETSPFAGCANERSPELASMNAWEALAITTMELFPFCAGSSLRRSSHLHNTPADSQETHPIPPWLLAPSIPQEASCNP
jgi:hypothetical protein